MLEVSRDALQLAAIGITSHSLVFTSESKLLEGKSIKFWREPYEWMSVQTLYGALVP